jgi:hypothetical protein
MNNNTLRLQLECADLQRCAGSGTQLSEHTYFLQQVRSCAYDIAKATKQLVTKFQYQWNQYSDITTLTINPSALFCHHSSRMSIIALMVSIPHSNWSYRLVSYHLQKWFSNLFCFTDQWNSSEISNDGYSVCFTSFNINNAHNSKLAFALLTAPVQLRRCIKMYTSEASASSCCLNTACFGPTGHDQVYKLQRKLLPYCHVATLCILKA